MFLEKIFSKILSRNKILTFNINTITHTNNIMSLLCTLNSNNEAFLLQHLYLNTFPSYTNAYITRIIIIKLCLWAMVCQGFFRYISVIYYSERLNNSPPKINTFFRYMNLQHLLLCCYLECLIGKFKGVFQTEISDIK